MSELTNVTSRDGYLVTENFDVVIQTNRAALRGFAILTNEKAYEKVRAAFAEQIQVDDEPWSMAARLGWHQALVAIPKHVGDPEESAHAQALHFQERFPEFNVVLLLEGEAVALADPN